jgi:hypothetical protein
MPLQYSVSVICQGLEESSFGPLATTVTPVLSHCTFRPSTIARNHTVYTRALAMSAYKHTHLLHEGRLTKLEPVKMPQIQIDVNSRAEQNCLSTMTLAHQRYKFSTDIQPLQKVEAGRSKCITSRRSVDT